MANPRSELHTLIGKRERMEKRVNMGNSSAEKKFIQYKKEVEDFLEKHPELKDQVEIIEDHFFKQLYK
jgi:predicted nuclease with TOPRIM domain